MLVCLLVVKLFFLVVTSIWEAGACSQGFAPGSSGGAGACVSSCSETFITGYYKQLGAGACSEAFATGAYKHVRACVWCFFFMLVVKRLLLVVTSIWGLVFAACSDAFSTGSYKQLGVGAVACV